MAAAKAMDLKRHFRLRHYWLASMAPISSRRSLRFNLLARRATENLWVEYRKSSREGLNVDIANQN